MLRDLVEHSQKENNFEVASRGSHDYIKGELTDQ